MIRPALILAALTAGLWAHDPKLTVARFVVAPDAIELVLTTPAASLAQFSSNQISEWRNPTRQKMFIAVLTQHLAISNEGEACAVEVSGVDWLESISSVRYSLRFTSPKTFDRLNVFYDLYLDLSDTFDNFNSAEFRLQGYTARYTFKPEHRSVELKVSELLKQWKLPPFPKKP